jgi:predicted esterase
MVSRFRRRSLARPLLLLALAATAPVAAGQESESAKAHAQHWSAAEKAAADNDFKEAAARYADVAALYPFEPTARYRSACCLARLGEDDRALAALKVAIECGWADTDALERAEDWKPLRGDARFAELVKAAAACRDEKVVVYAGDKVGRDRPAPLLVVLHGLGSGPRSEVPYWKPVAEKLGMVLVAPRSGTRLSPMLHGWHRAKAKDSSAADYFDLDEATKRVDAAIDEAAGQYKIDRGAVVLAGFSQGGGVALRLLADRPDRFRGAVAVNSLCQPLDEAKWQAVANRGGVRVQLIVGEYDKLLGRSQSAANVLQAAKVPSRFETVGKTGHEYPADYAKHLGSAAEFVLVGECPKK